MQMDERLKHATWECKYHAVFIPKCRRRVLHQGIRHELAAVLLCGPMRLPHPPSLFIFIADSLNFEATLSISAWTSVQSADWFARALRAFAGTRERIVQSRMPPPSEKLTGLKFAARQGCAITFYL
jgi:hypothetical protein